VASALAARSFAVDISRASREYGLSSQWAVRPRD
jgi:hypothetical protein